MNDLDLIDNKYMGKLESLMTTMTMINTTNDSKLKRARDEMDKMAAKFLPYVELGQKKEKEFDVKIQ
jgi:hypothetical protein